MKRSDPAVAVTNLVRDGALLVLSTTLRENGQPIWVVITLTRSGDTTHLAQMMEQSQTIKRGIGTKPPN